MEKKLRGAFFCGWGGEVACWLKPLIVGADVQDMLLEVVRRCLHQIMFELQYLSGVKIGFFTFMEACFYDLIGMCL
jgi:hypothetical protein